MLWQSWGWSGGGTLLACQMGVCCLVCVGETCFPCLATSVLAFVNCPALCFTVAASSPTSRPTAWKGELLAALLVASFLLTLMSSNHPPTVCSLVPDLASTCPDAAKRAELLAVHREAFTPDGKAKVSNGRALGCWVGLTKLRQVLKASFSGK